MKRRNVITHYVGGTLLAATVLLGGGAALANGKPMAPAAPVQTIKDERALTLLKGMSDTLARSQTLNFRVRGLVPLAAPTGQYVNLITSSHVVMQRPDKLFVESRGDMFPSDIYYDGKTLTAVAFDENFYAQREAANPTIDAFIQNAQPGSDALAPFVELLASDPYAVLTEDMSSALLVGQSVIGGVLTDHLAFIADGTDWEIWIGTADKLPRLMVVSYRDGRAAADLHGRVHGLDARHPGSGPDVQPRHPEGCGEDRIQAARPSAIQISVQRSNAMKQIKTTLLGLAVTASLLVPLTDANAWVAAGGYRGSAAIRRGRRRRLSRRRLLPWRRMLRLRRGRTGCRRHGRGSDRQRFAPHHGRGPAARDRRGSAAGLRRPGQSADRNPGRVAAARRQQHGGERHELLSERADLVQALLRVERRVLRSGAGAVTLRR